MSSLSKSFHSGYYKAKSCHDGEVEKTVETIQEIKTSVLPFSQFGMKIRSVNAFWTPLECTFLNHTNTGGNTKGDDAIGSGDGDLQAVWPPDGLLGPIWRTCHMGIIFEAYRDSENSDAALLTIAVELFDDGIRMCWKFGEPSSTKASVVKKLRSTDNPVYSAGVKREVDVELQVLLDVVASFKTSPYSVVGFNCQKFASTVFHEFTGQFLSDLLRRRWTTSHNMWGFREKTNEKHRSEAMDWASASSLLMEELEPVEGETFLFSRSPCGFGKASQTALVYAAVIARRSPMAAIVLAAGSLLAEKIPMFRRFERSTIWFKFNSEKRAWFWTPYRDGEVPSESERWISIHQHVVQLGCFAGATLERTNRRIISILANNADLYPSKTTDEVEMCSICLEGKLRSTFLKGKHCDHILCGECFAQLNRCPFCRADYE